MMIFQREIEMRIKERLFKKRAVLIFGPRQAGKTTLAKKIISPFGEDGAYFNCELIGTRKHFEVGNPDLLYELIGKRKIVVLDEAQTIEDIGAILKVFVDTYPDVQIIATGSSSFDLANKINEPLTGRTFEFFLYPLSLAEIRTAQPKLSEEDLHELMRTGSYPAIVAEPDKKIKEDLLKNLATNYLYKDIYTFESIKNPSVFEHLLRLIALQIGSLVSVNELSQELGIARATVEKYLRLLEQSYIITIVRPFSRNPRNEIKKAFKIYFIDTGVRNAIIDNASTIATRLDRGMLFENFVVSERMKTNAQDSFAAKIQFWRNRLGVEVDIIEESGGRIHAYECKWNDENQVSFSTVLKSYPNATTTMITPKVLLDDTRQTTDSA